MQNSISIMENSASLGFPVPSKLYKYLKIYNTSLDVPEEAKQAIEDKSKDEIPQ